MVTEEMNQLLALRSNSLDEVYEISVGGWSFRVDDALEVFEVARGFTKALAVAGILVDNHTCGHLTGGERRSQTGDQERIIVVQAGRRDSGHYEAHGLGSRHARTNQHIHAN